MAPVRRIATSFPLCLYAVVSSDSTLYTNAAVHTPMSMPNLLAPVTAVCGWEDVEYMRSKWKHAKVNHDVHLKEYEHELNKHYNTNLAQAFESSNQDLRTKIEALSAEYNTAVYMGDTNVLDNKQRAELIQLKVSESYVKEDIRVLKEFFSEVAEPAENKARDPSESLWSSVGFIGSAFDEASRAFSEQFKEGTQVKRSRSTECNTEMERAMNQLDSKFGEQGVSNSKEQIKKTIGFVQKDMTKLLLKRIETVVSRAKQAWKQEIELNPPGRVSSSQLQHQRRSVQALHSELLHLKRSIDQSWKSINASRERQFREYQSSARRLTQQMDVVMSSWTAAVSSIPDESELGGTGDASESITEHQRYEENVAPEPLKIVKESSTRINGTDGQSLLAATQEFAKRFLHYCAPFATISPEVERVMEIAHRDISDLAPELKHSFSNDQRHELQQLIASIDALSADLSFDERAVQSMYYNRAIYSLNHSLWMFSKRKSNAFAKLTHELVEYKIRVLEPKQQRMSELLAEVKQLYGPFSYLYLDELLLVPGRSTTTILSNLFDATGSDLVLLGFLSIPAISFLLLSARQLLFPFACVLGTIHMGYVATTTVNIALLYHPSLVQLLVTLTPVLSLLFFATKQLFLLPLKARVSATPSVATKELQAAKPSKLIDIAKTEMQKGKTQRISTPALSNNLQTPAKSNPRRKKSKGTTTNGTKPIERAEAAKVA